MSSRPTSVQPASPKYLVLLGLAGIVATTLIAYIPAIRAGFIWNDNTYVHKNRLLSNPSFSNLVRIWSFQKVARPDGHRYLTGHTEQYYPLVFTTYWLESHLWANTNPTGFHVINVLLHIANALLVWLILHRLKFPWAYIVALIFALHPVEVESVAWITERKNVLSGLFYLLAMLSYLRFDRDRRLPFYFLALLCFILALLSKTVTCTLPAVLLLILCLRHHRVSWAPLLRLLPFFIVGVLFGLFTAYLEQHSVGAVGSEWQIAFWQRCIIAGRAVFFYVSKLLWPINLTFIYPRWNPDEFSPLGLFWPLAVILIAAALWYWRKALGHAPLAAWVAFVVTLFPALGFFDVYPFRYSFVADHFQYLASIFSIVLFVSLAHRLYTHFHPQPLLWNVFLTAKVCLTLVVVVFLGSITYLQSSSYKDIKTLWQHTTRKNPQAWMAWNNLGAIHMQERNFPAAHKCFQQAILVRPDYAVACANLGQCLALQGQFDLAVSHFQQAIEFRPDYTWAHLKLADIYAQRRQYDLAVATYKKTIALAEASSLAADRRTTRISAHRHLSDVYAEIGQYSLAADHAQKALDLTRRYGLTTRPREIEPQLRK